MAKLKPKQEESQNHGSAETQACDDNVVQDASSKLSGDTVTSSFTPIFKLNELVLVVVFPAVFFYFVLERFMTSSPKSPQRDLQNFVLVQKGKEWEENGSIEELATEKFTSYAATHCLEGTSWESTYDALDANLSHIPESVRKEVLNMVLREA